MNYPIYPDKYKLPEMVTAQAMVEFRRRHSGLGDLQAPHGLVLCLYNGLMKRFTWRYPSQHIRSFQCDLYLLRATGKKVGVVSNFGMGAPALVSLAEQMIAWGTRQFIILSLAGGLQPDLEAGSVVVCNRAIRDEGTSYHYLPPAQQVEATPTLAFSIQGALEKHHLHSQLGTTWSTDAVYRETQQEADHFQRMGVETVDMESAGLFALGQMRGVETASVFVVGGRLTSSGWTLPGDVYALHQRFKSLLEVLLSALKVDG